MCGREEKWVEYVSGALNPKSIDINLPHYLGPVSNAPLFPVPQTHLNSLLTMTKTMSGHLR